MKVISRQLSVGSRQCAVGSRQWIAFVVGLSSSVFRHHSKYFTLAIFTFIATIATTSCTKNVDITIPKDSEKIAVEGTIEIDRPPIILLTNSQGFFNNINLNNLGAYFVHDAKITIVTEGDTIQLAEFCLNDLPASDEQKKQLLQNFGYKGDSALPIPNVCLYSIPDLINCILGGSCSFVGKENTRYDLRIEAKDKVLTSYTTIPKAAGIDSLTLRPRPKAPADDIYVAVYNNLTVPNTFGNFVRYWTKRNNEPFYLPGSQSVWDDKLFIGLKIALPVERGYQKGAKVEPEFYSFFEKGDTVTLKWANIDSRSYDFYFTLENDGGGSPFSAPVVVKSNINGGLGVWAGFASQYYTIVIPK